MTSRERVIRTLEFDRPDRAPRELWALAGVTLGRKDEYEAVLAKYPGDFAGADVRYGPSTRSRGTSGQVGTYVDEWGSEFTVSQFGVCGEVKRPPLADWGALDGWTPPWELLDQADFSRVNASCKATDKFVKIGTHTRPFERLQFLRGSENLFLDLAMRPPEFERLRALIHQFETREMAMWAQTDVDAVSFMDDWGAQHSLLISPEVWREIFKPMYKVYCDILKAAGKYIFFHSDGCTRAIIPDLIELGIDAFNTQIFCMDIEELGRAFKGRITFWGEISRQDILPFGTVDEVREAVRRVRRAFDDGSGGVIAECEWGVRDPRENVEAVFETWLE